MPETPGFGREGWKEEQGLMGLKGRAIQPHTTYILQPEVWSPMATSKMCPATISSKTVFSVITSVATSMMCVLSEGMRYLSKGYARKEGSKDTSHQAP